MTVKQSEVYQLYRLLLEAQSELDERLADDIPTPEHDEIAKPPEHIHTPLCTRTEGWEIMNTLAKEFAEWGVEQQDGESSAEPPADDARARAD